MESSDDTTCDLEEPLIATSVAPVIWLFIRKAIYQLWFLAYQYWIGSIIEKAADTDMCIYLETHAHMD